MSALHLGLLAVGFATVGSRLKGVVLALRTKNWEAASVDVFFLFLAVSLFSVLWLYT